MEDPIINPHNFIDFKLMTRDLPLLSNDIDRGAGEDHAIEMMAFQSICYTSLKDVLPASTLPSVASPTSGSSWREIPIKDPLVQHAAWAYLQPMAEARDHDERWWRRLQENCCGLFGCLNGVVAVVFKGLFGGGDRRVD